MNLNNSGLFRLTWIQCEKLTVLSYLYYSTSTISEKKKVWFCYLLKTAKEGVRARENAYIGMSDNPFRRIKQHNGELPSGALRTQEHRPWEIKLIVGGFKSKSDALGFEVAWHNPHLWLQGSALKFLLATLADSKLSSSLRKAMSVPKSKMLKYHNFDTCKSTVFLLLHDFRFQCSDLYVHVLDEKIWSWYKRKGTNCPKVPPNVKIELTDCDKLEAEISESVVAFEAEKRKRKKKIKEQIEAMVKSAEEGTEEDENSGPFAFESSVVYLEPGVLSKLMATGRKSSRRRFPKIPLNPKLIDCSFRVQK